MARKSSASGTTYEVMHAFNHEGVYYTRDNQHLIAENVKPDVIEQLVGMKMLRAVPVEAVRGESLDERHAALRKLPAAKDYAEQVSASLEERGLAHAAEDAQRAHEDAIVASGADAAERSTTKGSHHKGGR